MMKEVEEAVFIGFTLTIFFPTTLKRMRRRDEEITEQSL